MGCSFQHHWMSLVLSHKEQGWGWSTPREMLLGAHWDHSSQSSQDFGFHKAHSCSPWTTSTLWLRAWWTAVLGRAITLHGATAPPVPRIAPDFPLLKQNLSEQPATPRAADEHHPVSCQQSRSHCHADAWVRNSPAQQLRQWEGWEVDLST